MATGQALKIRGLRTADNQISGVGEGALAQADNVMLRFLHLLESRRGESFLAAVSPPSAVTDEGFFYGDVLMTHAGSNLYHHDGSTFVLNGTVAAPDPAIRMKFVEAVGNLYVSSNVGMKLLTASDATPSQAGVPKALTAYATLVSPNGWMSYNTAVAYRSVFGIRDANNNVKLGAPSDRCVLRNRMQVPIGGLVRTGGATVTVTLPTGRYFLANLAIGDRFTLSPGEANFATASYVITGVTTTVTSVVFTYADAGANVASTVVEDLQMVRCPQVVAKMPTGITTSHFVRIYRSYMSPVAATDPDDELFQVYEAAVSGSDVALGGVAITDATPESFLGDALYTNPNTGDGINSANEPPPVAKDMCLFNGRVFYFNTKQKVRQTVQLVGITGPLAVAIGGLVRTGGNLVTATLTVPHGLAVGDVVSLTPGEANFAAGSKTLTGVTNDKVFTYAEGGANVASANAQTLNIVTSATNTGLRAGDTVTLSGTPVGGSFLVETFSFVVTPAAGTDVRIETGGTPAQNIERTARNFVDAVNTRADSAEYYYAHYVSGPDDPPGLILLEERALGSDPAGSIITASRLTTWTGMSIPDASGTFTGLQTAFANGGYYSKRDQPEAVPLLYHTAPIGPRSAEILRALAFRDKIFVFLKAGGIYTVSGLSPPFRVDLLDDTVNLLAPDSVVTHANQVFALTDQGVVAISDAGVRIVSGPIDDTLRALVAANPTGLSRAFGVSYESERLYLLHLPSATSGNSTTQSYVYNSAYDAWTRWPVHRSWGRVRKTTQILYGGDGDVAKVRVERKALDRTDYADESVAVTIDASSGTGVDLDGVVTGIAVGDLLWQSESVKSLITAVDYDRSAGVTSVTVASTEGWAVAGASVFLAIPCSVQWAPQVSGGPGLLKQVRQLILHVRRFVGRAASVFFDSEIQEAQSSVALTRPGYGLTAFGQNGFGDTTKAENYRVQVPQNQQQATQVRPGFSIREARAYWAIQGFSTEGEGVSERTGK